MSSSGMVYLYPQGRSPLPTGADYPDLCAVELYRFVDGKIEYYTKHIYPARRQEFVQALLDDGFTGVPWMNGILNFNREGDMLAKMKVVNQVKLLRELQWEPI